MCRKGEYSDFTRSIAPLPLVNTPRKAEKCSILHCSCCFPWSLFPHRLSPRVFLSVPLRHPELRRTHVEGGGGEMKTKQKQKQKKRREGNKRDTILPEPPDVWFKDYTAHIHTGDNCPPYCYYYGYHRYHFPSSTSFPFVQNFDLLYSSIILIPIPFPSFFFALSLSLLPSSPERRVLLYSPPQFAASLPVLRTLKYLGATLFPSSFLSFPVSVFNNNLLIV